jgi:hypothetical protein
MPPPERRASESPAAFRAFCDYTVMGSGGKRRSIRELADYYAGQSASGSLADRPPTLSVKTLFGWSMRYDWDERSVAWDQQQQIDEEAARQAIRAQRRVELEEADWQHGSMIRQKVAEIVAELPRFIRRTVQRIEKDGQVTEVITLALNAGPGELARALELASKLQRLSVGEATDHTRHSGPAGGPIEIHAVDYRAGLDALKPEDSPAE